MKHTIPPLTNGLRYTYDGERRICVGAYMGRPNYLPDFTPTAPIKMHLVKLKLVDGCYDQGGAYWGSPSNLYRAVSVEEIDTRCSEHRFGRAELFIRAPSRRAAKEKVRQSIRTATFFR